MDNLLRYLDIAIGFTMVMLIASALVTVITQWFMSWKSYRSQILGWGIKRLIAQLNPTLADYAEEISQKVLSHPLVADLDKRGNAKAGSAIHREDFIRVLLELAQSPILLPNDKAREALCRAIGADQKDTPAELLKKIQRRAMELEALFPEAARYVWQAKAIVEQGGGQFVADVMAWFDQTSDRLTEVFTQKARFVSMMVALVVAILLPLDSVELLRHLSTDDKLTAELVAQAQKEVNKAGPVVASGDLKKDIEILQELRDRLDQPNLAILPVGWWPEKVMNTKLPPESGKEFNGKKCLLSIFGVLLSAALMSLGAPFWFDMLKNLLKLRPAVAANEEKDRKDRASTQSEAVQKNLTSQATTQAQTSPPASADPEAGIFGNAEVAPGQDARG